MNNKLIPILLLLVSPVLNQVCAKPKNVLLILADDLRPELASFGADYIHSPNIDRLAQQGRPFHRHFVNAPSCGPSRNTLLTGRYGGEGNEALFERAEQLKKDPKAFPPSMPEWFRRHGYTTVSVGKVSHHPGGRGGDDWNDDAILEIPNGWDRHLMPVAEWQHPRGAMHGLAHGEIRGDDAKEMDVFQSIDGPDTIYPDGLIVEEGMWQLEELASDDKPFFLAIGVIKPHLPFGAPAKYMQYYNGVDLPPIPHPEKPDWPSTWHKSSEFMKYNLWGKDPNKDPDFATEVRRHYAACVSYVDKHVGDILATLNATGKMQDTIVLLWGDHGWHLGEHAVWGKHTLFEESLHSPLIIWHDGISQPGRKTDAIVSTLDIFPTLCELAGIENPGFAHGQSLVPMLKDPGAAGHDAFGYFKGTMRTVRNGKYRLIVQEDGSVELYDQSAPDGGARNIADQNPKIVERLRKKINTALGGF